MGESTVVWRMYAHATGDTITNLVSLPWVKLHGLQDSIVEVQARLVSEGDPAATHWGWLPADKDEPCMFWPSLPQYTMCFPYGPAAAEKVGQGRTVRLAVTRVEAEE